MAEEAQGDEQVCVSKKEPNYTHKELDEKLHVLFSQRKSKMAQLTSKMTEIDTMKDNGESANKVESEILDSFPMLYKEFITLNHSVTELLPEAERSMDQLHWYVPKSAAIKEFVLGTERWIKEQRKAEIVDDIAPSDSVSEVESRRRGKSIAGSISGCSSVSATSSAVRRREEARRAALLAEAASLKKKQALRAEMEQLESASLKKRAEMEQLELETALAASTARLKVLEGYEKQGRAKNEYVQSQLSSTGIHGLADRILGHHSMSYSDIANANSVLKGHTATCDADKDKNQMAYSKIVVP